MKYFQLSKTLFLTSSIVIAGWFLYTRHNTVSNIITMPDSFAEQVTITQFDRHGIITETLSTPYITQYNKMAKLNKPSLLFYIPSKQPWQLTSTFAHYYEQHIQFQDNVILYQSSDSHHPAFILKTDRLDYFPKQGIINTRSPVHFIQSGTQIHSNGMQFNIDKAQLTLLSKMEGFINATETIATN